MKKVIATNRKMYPMDMWKSIKSASISVGMSNLYTLLRSKDSYVIIPGTQYYIMLYSTFLACGGELTEDEEKELLYEDESQMGHEAYWAALLDDVEYHLERDEYVFDCE